MNPVANQKWPGGYSFRPFKITTTERKFEYSRRRPAIEFTNPRPSNVAALWTARQQETLINGVLQGRKQTDPKSGSAVCRLKTSRLVLDTLALLAIPALVNGVGRLTYADLKKTESLKDRDEVKRSVKELALAGWIPNLDDDFSLLF